MTRARGESSRCITWIGAHKYTVKIGFAREAGRVFTLYVGTAPNHKAAQKMRNVAEICRDAGRETGNLTTKEEILEVWSLCKEITR